jgi:branched-chain amino acid transport system substrate-binding protein
MQREISRLWRVLVVGLSLALVLAACGGDDEDGGGGEDGGGEATEEEAPESLSLGFMGALSGPNAQLGINIQQGAALAIQEWNEENDTQVELIDYDTAGEPDQAIALAPQAVSDGVVGIIGPAFSGESAQAVPILEEAALTNISPSATAVDLAENGWEFWHRIVGNDGVQGPGAAQYILDELGAQNVAIVHDASEYGQPLADTVASEVEAGGGTIAVNEAIDPEAPDYSSTVNNVNAAGVDAIFYGGYYAEASRLITQLRDGGVEATFVSDDGVLDPQFVEGAGDAAEGSIITCPCNWASAEAEDADIAAFAEAYEAEFGSPPATYSTEGYDAASLFLAAIEAGNTDSESINEWLETASLDGVSKDISFNEQGELAEATIFLHEITGGEFIPIGEAGS